MYMVYWTQVEDEKAAPHSLGFASDDLSGALKFMEELRARQRAGERLCFITMSSENPDSVGPPGVADPHPDYNWKKRRR
ncbi:MAG TPA: hypothetical protein VJ698_19555 [Noviherbaspirillum sp.]|uniref:hypothetical protein n=1 Tax=Noviherbaspirillum sp. TaxID=1926288 RepID=UPI002B45F0D4|nr:hypothetical protein [Noviherbaspirillum sp.]HJV87675.1 hypothetical protein [Noviherbaspirillum sp.]